MWPLADAPVDDELKEKAAAYRAEMIELAEEQDEVDFFIVFLAEFGS